MKRIYYHLKTLPSGDVQLKIIEGKTVTPIDMTPAQTRAFARKLKEAADAAETKNTKKEPL